MIRTRWLGLALCTAAACSHAPPEVLPQTHSGPIAISPDGSRLFVVHPDADSVSILDTATRKIVREILLAPAAPVQDPVTHRYDPVVSPRALALDAAGETLFVTGQRSGHLYEIDVAQGTVSGSVAVCAEPIGVLVAAGGAGIFVACAQDDEVVQVKQPLAIAASVPCPRKPWALAWAGDGHTLYVTHFLGPGVSVFETAPLSLRTTWTVADGPSTGDAMEPHGQVRGLYDAVIRPGTEELWVAHMMLGTDTPQPALDFQRTVFPSLSLFDGTGQALARLSVKAHIGGVGAFDDVVSGPRALAFSPDGKFAFLVDTDSEDVLVVDAVKRAEARVVRPLPGHLPEGIAWGKDNQIYVQERGTEDIAVFRVAESSQGVSVTLDGTAFPSLSADPMPAELRLGQKLFFSSNSDDVPITQNHWVACASCHLEGRSDAVTWLFAQGPRDTPSNAGGTRDTGFLFRTADRNQVQDYWKTINVEQGGHFSLTDPTQKPLLDAVTDYVNDAIPIPIPPRTDPVLRARGAQVFNQIGCAACHSGPALTDSGAGNPTLDLAGTVLLHDVGTCVVGGPFPDVAHLDKDGNARAACAFDTPALRGLWDSAPYLHDGSAATLDDAVKAMLAIDGGSPSISTPDRAALVEYLKSL